MSARIWEGEGERNIYLMNEIRSTECNQSATDGKRWKAFPQPTDAVRYGVIVPAN